MPRSALVTQLFPSLMRVYRSFPPVAPKYLLVPYKNLKARAIDPAVKELNANTEVSISYADSTPDFIVLWIWSRKPV